MAFIDWDQTYSVGVEIIDNQHKRLFELINDFHSAKTNLDQAIQDLLSYVDFHFKTEERYFDKFGYEKTVEHRQQHKFYEERIGALYARCLKEKIDEGKISAEIEGFVKDWISQHIHISDKEYSKCFHEHGLH